MLRCNQVEYLAILHAICLIQSEQVTTIIFLESALSRTPKNFHQSLPPGGFKQFHPILNLPLRRRPDKNLPIILLLTLPLPDVYLSQHPQRKQIRQQMKVRNGE